MKKYFFKFLSFFSGFKPGVNTRDLNDFDVRFNNGNMLEVQAPVMNRLSETYVLIRKLLFYPEIKINIMQSFKSLLKWKDLNLHCNTALRNYPLGFEVSSGEFGYPEIHLPEYPNIREEIVRVSPYVRKIAPKKLFKIPFIKKPVYKSYFSRDEVKLLREKAAEQNQTGWSNIEIFEIYDKFHYNFFSSIKQIPGSKELECMPNISARGKTPGSSSYLVIGKKRNTGEPVKAIIDPADIKKEN